MATKRGKQSGSRTRKTRTKTQTKATTAKPAARRPTPDRRVAEGRVTSERRPVPAVATAREPSPLERAERLRAVIERTKLTAADPWAYTPKARRWGQRAQALVERIARSGPTAAPERELAALTTEVEGDRDFQEARRLF